jgi:hypothetical protein
MTLEVKSVGGGRITVTSSDGTQELECDRLTIPFDPDAPNEVLAHGAVVVRMGHKQLKTDAVRLQFNDKGEWLTTSDKLTVGT